MNMKNYANLLLIAAVTVYIVDVSGFTDSWRSALARWLKVSSLRPLPPFDCGKCATWWVCVIYLAIVGDLAIPSVAFSALLSLLSLPIGQLLIFIREGLLWIINKILPQ